MSLIGTRIGSIRIDAELGVGGMGEVYRGFDTRLERAVAVKTIRRDERFDSELKARFLREARILGKLGHPGICQVYDLVESAEADYLVLEFIDGVTLRERVRRDIDRQEILRLAREIAVALAAAHRENVVHRDLKPDNVMVTASGAIKILDFGIARALVDAGALPADSQAQPSPPPPDQASADDGLREPPIEDCQPATSITGPRPRERESAVPASADADATVPGGDPEQPARRMQPVSTDDITTAGTVLGTRRYMSPEQARDSAVDCASDMYAFGVMLDEIIHSCERAARRANVPAPPRDSELAALLAQLQSYLPDRRPSALETAERLTGLLDRPRRLRRRRQRQIAVSALGALLLVVSVLMARLAYSARQAREEAEARRTQAESLIDFMLGDLRGKLEGVGRLELLADVNQRALAYFDALPVARLSPHETELRLHHLTQIADVMLQSGNSKAAGAPIEQAMALARQAVAQTPDRPQSLVALAECESWLGYIALEQEQPAQQALEHFQSAMVWAGRAAALAPSDEKVMVQLSSTYNNVGAAQHQLDRTDQAIASLLAAIEWRRRVLSLPARDNKAGDQAQLAASLGWLSSAYEAAARFDQALVTRREQVDTLKALHLADAGNHVYASDLAVALRYLGGLLAVREESSERESVLRNGVQLAEQLVADDPANAAWTRNCAVFQSLLGDFLLEQGHADAARAPLDRALVLLRGMLAKDVLSDEGQAQLALATARRALADLQRDPRDAADRIGIAEQLFNAHRAAGEQSETPNLMLAQIRRMHGDALLLAGRAADARAAWEQGLRSVPDAAPDSRDWRALSLAASLQFRLGESAAATASAARVSALGAMPIQIRQLCAQLHCATLPATSDSPAHP